MDTRQKQHNWHSPQKLCIVYPTNITDIPPRHKPGCVCHTQQIALLDVMEARGWETHLDQGAPYKRLFIWCINYVRDKKVGGHHGMVPHIEGNTTEFAEIPKLSIIYMS